MKARGFAESLRFAVMGIVEAFRTERNLRTHFALGALVLLFARSLDLSRVEMAVLVLTIGFVITAELVNTAVESAVDLWTDRYHPLAARAKNVAAGAVLASAVTSAFVGYLLFFDRIARLHGEALQRTVTVPSFAAVVVLFVIIAAVMAVKAGSGGVHRRRRAPSFHAAMAGALATAVFLLSRDALSVVLSAVLALMVAQGRIEGEARSAWEVGVSGALGMLATVLLFSLFTGSS